MRHDFIPKKFSHFFAPINAIVLRHPTSISIVGSYGNPNKKPTESSDLDLIFVFDTELIYEVFQGCLNDLYKIDGLRVIELGVHFRYGYVVSVYYADNPLCWVDIGVMDVNFAENYLVNLPRKDVFGSIQNCGIGQNPLHQMNHLARKILVARGSRKVLTVEIACYRYLAWLKVHSDIQIYKGRQERDCLEVVDLFGSGQNEDKCLNVVELVLSDIERRFPEIWRKNGRLLPDIC